MSGMDVFYICVFVGLLVGIVASRMGGGATLHEGRRDSPTTGHRQAPLINPATGLVMNGPVDVAGNTYGSSGL